MTCTDFADVWQRAKAETASGTELLAAIRHGHTCPACAARVDALCRGVPAPTPDEAAWLARLAGRVLARVADGEV